MHNFTEMLFSGPFKSNWLSPQKRNFAIVGNHLNFENLLAALGERFLPQKGFWKICWFYYNLFWQMIVAGADEISGVASGAVISVQGRHIGAWLSFDSPLLVGFVWQIIGDTFWIIGFGFVWQIIEDTFWIIGSVPSSPPHYQLLVGNIGGSAGGGSLLESL